MRRHGSARFYDRKVSVVVPLDNEKESLEELHGQIKSVLVREGLRHEIIFIDDGSTDRSLEVLPGIAMRDKSVRLFSFRKNQGKALARAYLAGDVSSGSETPGGETP